MSSSLCVTVLACSAAGSSVDSSSLVESWTGTTWSIVASPDKGEGDDLDDVSCVSASACSAVGSYVNTNGISRTLVESWNGTTWSIVASPNKGTSLSHNIL